MNTPIEISSLADYINLIDEIADPDINYLYRGQENEAWHVTSSAYRRLASQVDADAQGYDQTLAEPYYGGDRDGKQTD